MRIQVKIFIALTIAIIVLFASILAISYQNINRKIYHQTLSIARDIRALIMSTRRIYQHQFLESGVALTDKTVGFLPAHSLPRISEDYKNWTNSGIRFNAVSDRPRNPRNKADTLEMEAMQFFRLNPDEEERMTKQKEADTDQEYYHYSRPIWIEQYCLKCHGNAADAPVTIQERYQQSYGYKVGDMRGLLSIKLPISVYYEKAIQQWRTNIFKVLPILLLTWLVLAYWFRRHIGIRLEKLQSIAKRIGHGDYTLSDEKTNKDEIGTTFKSMNTMASRIHQREQSIKQANILYKILSMTNELLLRRVGTEQIYQEICHIAVTHGQFNLAWICLLDAENTQLNTIAVEGSDAKFVKGIGLKEDANKAYPKGIKNYILEGRTVIINDLQHSDLSGHWATFSQQSEVLSTAQVPLVVNTEVIGVLSVCSANCDYFRTEVINLLQEVCRDVAFALDINNKEQERIATAEQVTYLSQHDQLTSLPNRNWLLKRLQQVVAGAIHHGHIGALLYVDLDNFKLINDSLGQQIGDEVLRQTASDIVHCLKEEDSVVRGSGDEFIVLLEELSDDADDARKQVQTVADNIQSKLRISRIIDQNRIDIYASIGIALFPFDNKDASELIQCAATALHVAKQDGKNSSRFYHREMQLVLNKRLTLEADLRLALERQEFEMYYQPKIDVFDKTMSGAEGLIRWNHSEKGLISPDQFIPVLEESGQIIPVGSWVIHEVFSQVSEVFSQQKTHQEGSRFAINVSPLQFKQADFVAIVQRAIEETGVDPNLIELEITENLLISDAGNLIKKMTQLKELGIHFSLDDFGTGYSSLSYLKQLPLDVIKIDRVFISTMLEESSSADIVETILEIARRFHLDVIAEGVETEQELEFLKLRHCDLIQGYLFSKPLCVADFLKKYYSD